MTRKEIAADIKAEIGNFPTVSEIKKYLGMSQHTVEKVLQGVQSYKTCTDGKTRHYFAADLARRLEELEAV